MEWNIIKMEQKQKLTHNWDTYGTEMEQKWFQAICDCQPEFNLEILYLVATQVHGDGDV